MHVCVRVYADRIIDDIADIKLLRDIHPGEREPVDDDEFGRGDAEDVREHACLLLGRLLLQSRTLLLAGRGRDGGFRLHVRSLVPGLLLDRGGEHPVVQLGAHELGHADVE
jgi:hypothetical protein